MLRFKSRVHGFDFKKDKYLKDFDAIVLKTMKEAVWEWLGAVLKNVSGAPYTLGDSFPIQTGEAKGSLLALAEHRDIRYPFPIAAGPPAPGRKDQVSLGKSKAIVNFGRTPVRLFYNFRFSTSVEHFNLLEDTRVGNVKSSPWKVFDAGFLAFDAYLRANLVNRLPNITDYVLTKTIK